jgi:gentisate 1,2-dioxygenase
MADDDDGIVPTVDKAAERSRADFYDRARSEHLAPLWRVLHGLVTETPKPSAVPAHFAYERVRPYLMEACALIGTEEAERRVMVLENPGLPGQSKITTSLFCGLQIILPGEIAPAHRHVASALRFIVEGSNAYSAIAGERTMMEVGDFVITPSMTWHDHGNLSDDPVIWMDGLDMHIVNLFGASFREGYPDKAHPTLRPAGSTQAEVGMNLLPDGFVQASQTSPIFNYPYRQTREALHRLTGFRDPDPCHGYRMNYINPLTGGSAMPTMSTAMRLLPKGFVTTPYRSTAGTVFNVVEGSGTARIGDETFRFAPRDIFVVPSWIAVTIEAAEESVLFSYSDQIAQEKLDFFREVRGNA